MTVAELDRDLEDVLAERAMLVDLVDLLELGVEPAAAVRMLADLEEYR